jgi:hypothetical protein
VSEEAAEDTAVEVQQVVVATAAMGLHMAATYHGVQLEAAEDTAVEVQQYATEAAEMHQRGTGRLRSGKPTVPPGE